MIELMSGRYFDQRPVKAHYWNGKADCKVGWKGE